MRQVFGEWGVVTETKSTSYGILSAPVANNIRGYLMHCGNDISNDLPDKYRS